MTPTRSVPRPRPRLLVATLMAAAGISVGAPSFVAAAAPEWHAAAASDVVGLREGAQGPAVLAVQEALVGFGYYVAGGADGNFGPGTTAALRVFQEQNGLNPTGVVTENTARYLGLDGSAATTGSDSASASATSSTGLQRGASGEQVRRLQEALMAPPFSLVLRNGADGTFGAGTERAVRLVQRWNGLPVTGIVDQQTAQLIGLAGGSSSSPSTSDVTGLQYGAQGSDVERIQRLLIQAGYSIRGGADGVFGSATRSAVRSFQQSNGLSVTGKVDAATERALTNAAAAAQPSSAARIAIDAAMTQVSVPYRYGLAAPGYGFDCSGLTSWAWRQAGVELPYHSGLQYATIPHVAAADARPGDLLFFHSPISHVGIYLGGGRMIDAPRPGSVVAVRPFTWSSVRGVGRPG